MSKTRKKTAAIADALVVLLLFCGVALIAAGLWLVWKPLSLIFMGVVVWYIAGCINLAASSHERTDKK